MPRSSPPTERVYLHRQCGFLTQISGNEFLRLANPFAVAIACITGSAATEDDDAIQLIVDLMAQEDIPEESVLRLDSERQPSLEWQGYFAARWPNAAITWSFAPGQEAEMEAAVDGLLGGAKKPWWRFW